MTTYTFHRFSFLLMVLCIVASAPGPAQTLTITHHFENGTHPNAGRYPLSALVQGSDGDFYGTTNGGGAGKDLFGRPAGTAYKITPKGTVTILHNFGDETARVDGAQPQSTLIQGRDGNFYGTTEDGNDFGGGTIFQITPTGTETLIARFTVGAYTSTANTTETLVLGSDGNLYGASYGQSIYGTIFRIAPGNGETILHAFHDGSTRNDGQNPTGIVFGRNGKIYGTTLRGGASDGGTVFIMTLPDAFMSVRPVFSPRAADGTPVP